MTKTIRVLLPIAALLIGLAAAVAVIKARPTVDRQQVATLPPLVRVIEAQSTSLQLVVRAQGTVQPLVESTIVAQVAGRIEWVSPDFAEGGFFHRSDKLIQIDSRDYELVVSQAEAQVAQAQVRLQLEAAEAELAREEWQELGTGSGNPLALREPQMAEARAAVQAAEAALEKARLDLERTAIRAQFDGRVRAKLVDLGQFINRGTPIVNVYSTQAAEVRLPVRKDDLLFVGLDPSLRLESNAAARPDVILRASIGGAEYEWDGQIVRTGSEFDANTRMLPLFARIDDPLRRRTGATGTPLPMGLFVDAEIDGIEVQDVFLLPRSAIRDDSQVLVVDGESRLRTRDIEIVRLERDRALVKAGLAPNDLVCVSQIEAVVDGMSVRTQIEDSVLPTDANRETEL